MIAEEKGGKGTVILFLLALVSLAFLLYVEFNGLEDITGRNVLDFSNVSLDGYNDSIIVEFNASGEKIVYIELEERTYSLARMDIVGRNETGEYPYIPRVDVLDDGEFEWANTGRFDSAEETDDFSSDLNLYISNCGEYPCPVPIKVYSDSAGIIELKNLYLVFGGEAEQPLPPASSPISSLEPAKIDSGIEEEIQEKSEAKVIVVLKDEPVETGMTGITGQPVKEIRKDIFKEKKAERLEKIKQKVKEKQEKVLSELELEDKTERGILGIAQEKKAEFKLERKYSTVNAFSGKVTEEGLRKLEDNPDVEAVYLVPTLHISLDDTVPLIQADHMHNYSVDGENITGKGQTICIIDTGIQTDHPDFQNRVIDEYCYCTASDYGNGGCCHDNTNESDVGDDDNDHGTHCAGIAAADGTVVGVAPESNLIAIKVCDSSGDCDGDDMMAGMDWCIANSTRYNISVISMSLGDWNPHSPGNCPDWMDSSINNAHDSDILFVSASGNTGNTTGIDYPACSQNTTGIGAVTKSDVIWTGTSRHPDLLDILAPGAGVYSTVPTDNYATNTGTSMATPHAAGAAALIYQYAELEGLSFSVDDVVELMIDNGKTIGDYSRVDFSGIFLKLEENITANLTAYSLGKEGIGKIGFYNYTEFGNILDRINISYNYAEIDASSALEYNKSAIITLDGLNFDSPFVEYFNGTEFEECNSTTDPACINISYNGSRFVFNVSHFTGFRAAEGGNDSGEGVESATITKTALNESVINGSIIQFIVNITNTGITDFTNYELTDRFNKSYINYTGANRTPDDIRYDGGEIEWLINLSAGESEIFLINFTTYTVGNTTNIIDMENSTGSSIGYDNESIEVLEEEEEETRLYDLGDAPDSCNHFYTDMETDPSMFSSGITADYPTVHNTTLKDNCGKTYGPCHENYFLILGRNITFEDEADVGNDEDFPDNNIKPNANESDFDSVIGTSFGMDDGLGSTGINYTNDMFNWEHCQNVSIPIDINISGGPYAADWNATLNIWIDYNKDGNWADSPWSQDTVMCGMQSVSEWVVQNDVAAQLNFGGFGPGQIIHYANFTAFSNISGYTWMRVQVTPGPINSMQYADGSGPAVCYEDGETEDYYVNITYLEEEEEGYFQNLSISKTSLDDNVTNGSTAEFLINITNTGNINFSSVELNDSYDINFLNYSSSSKAYEDNAYDGDIIWVVHDLASDSSSLIYVNFTALDVGNTTNHIFAENSTGSLMGYDNESIEILGEGEEEVQENVTNLSCEVTTNCTYTKVLGLSSLTNAHAELANESNYNYSICCRDISNTVNIVNDSGTVFIRLSDSTNAHVELPSEGNYAHDAYIGTDSLSNSVECSYLNTSGACSENTTCLMTLPTNISGNTNLQPGDCVTNPYLTSVCCGIVEDSAPIVTLLSPADNHYNDSAEPEEILFNCSATDDKLVDNISMYLTDKDDTNFKINYSCDIDAAKGSCSKRLNLTNGNYTWNCAAYDNISQETWGNNRTIVVNYTACIPELVNTTWTEWINISCVSGKMNQSRNRTQYDNNSCGIIANQTFYEYQLVGPDYENTTWGDWMNLTCVGSQMNQSRNRTQYDEYGCAPSITHYDYQLVGPNYENTSWSDWINISCLPDDTMNQSRNRTQYDEYGCAANQTFIEYRHTEFCDYCTPNMTNTSWRAYYNISPCYENDTIEQERNRTQYDSTYCGEVGNTTFFEQQIIACINPPSSVTGLVNISSTNETINWTWTNPSEADFNSTILYLNGSNIINLSSTIDSYKAAGLQPNSSYNLTVHTKDHNGNINYTDVSNIAQTTRNPILPIADNFSGEYGTTNFSDVSDITNVKNLTLARAGGRIKFPGSYGVDAEAENYDLNVLIGDGFVSVNTSALDTSFNASAEITINNVSCPSTVYYGGGLYSSSQEIVGEGNVCDAGTDPSCTNVTCMGNILTFTTSHFTGFASAATANLTIWDETDNTVKAPDEQIRFFANYTNSTGEIEGANCTINFNSSLNNNMGWNATSRLYEYNRSFSSTGMYGWNATCNKTGYDTLTASDTVIVMYNNTVPGMDMISLNPNTGMNNTAVNVTSIGANDTDGQQLRLECGDSTGNYNLCTGNYGSPERSCIFNSPWDDDSTHQVYCAVYDGVNYSIERNNQFFADNTAPVTLAVHNIEGDSTTKYWDSVEDNKTLIQVILNESEVNCRWSIVDAKYDDISSANECAVQGSLASCNVTPSSQINETNVTISCEDKYGNDQNVSQNLEVIYGVDWTKPTVYTTNNGMINPPGYSITFVETDVPAGTEIMTWYCNDTSDNCTPSTSIDNGSTVSYYGRGNWYVKWNATDEAGNVNMSGQTVVMINILPDVTMHWYEDLVNHTFNVYINASDIDNSQNLSCQIFHRHAAGGAWNITNMSLYSGTLTNGSFMGNISEADGYTGLDNIESFVNCTDGVEYYNSSPSTHILPNYLPTRPVVDLIPDNATTTNNLICNITNTSTDIDGDDINYTYEWYRDGILNRTVYYTNDTYNVLSADNTTKHENWNCTVIPYDNYENGTSDSDDITIANTPPAQPTVNIIPGLPITTDDLNCSVTGTDADNDSLNYTYRWYKDGDFNYSVYTNKTSIILGKSNTTKGEEWNCSVIAYDGEENGSMSSDSTVIQNAPPSAASGFNPRKFHNLTQKVKWTEGIDPDGDSVSSYLCVSTNSTWRDADVCDVVNLALTATPDYTFNLGELQHIGESRTYYVRIIETDGLLNSVDYDTNFNLTNLRPNATAVDVMPNMPNSLDTLICNYSFNDGDEDGENVSGAEFKWYVQDEGAGAFVEQAGQTNKTLDTGFDRDDVVKCAALVEDEYGLNDSAYRNGSTELILNAPPNIAIDLVPDNASSSDNLICNVTSSYDVDGDNLNYTYEWYKDDIFNRSIYTNQTFDIIGAGNTSDYEKWLCNVTPYDGIVNGTAISDYVVVGNAPPSFVSAVDDADIIKGGDNVTVSTESSDENGDMIWLYVCNSTSVSSAGCNDKQYCSNLTSLANASCSFASEIDNNLHKWYAYLYDNRTVQAVNDFEGNYTTDSDAPITDDDSVSDTTWYSSYVNISLNATDNIAGVNRTYYCVYDAGEAACTPNILSYNNPRSVEINCSGEESCQQIIRYYSADNVENVEGVKESFKVNIAVGSTVNNTNATNSTIINSTIINSTIINSTIINSTVINSTILNSTKVNCTIIDSIIENSVNYNCELRDVGEYGSRINDSDFNQSFVNESTIWNLSGFGDIRYDNVYGGNLSYNNYTYAVNSTLPSPWSLQNIYAQCGDGVCAGENVCGPDNNYPNCNYDCGPCPGTATAPSGGGGGASRRSICVEQWQCRPWGICYPNGTQYRECWDMNRCDDLYNQRIVTRINKTQKPATYRACSYVKECYPENNLFGPLTLNRTFKTYDDSYPGSEHLPENYILYIGNTLFGNVVSDEPIKDIRKYNYNFDATPGEYLLYVGNNDDASVIIEINGRGVVNPYDFNPSVHVITRKINLSSQNKIDIELRSKPGSSIVVWIGELCSCSVDSQCNGESFECDNEGICVSKPSCEDGIKNQDETGIDCGGSMCEACVEMPAAIIPRMTPYEHIMNFAVENIVWPISDFVRYAYMPFVRDTITATGKAFYGIASGTYSAVISLYGEVSSYLIEKYIPASMRLLETIYDSASSFIVEDYIPFSMSVLGGLWNGVRILTNSLGSLVTDIIIPFASYIVKETYDYVANVYIPWSMQIIGNVSSITGDALDALTDTIYRSAKDTARWSWETGIDMLNSTKDGLVNAGSFVKEEYIPWSLDIIGDNLIGFLMTLILVAAVILVVYGSRNYETIEMYRRYTNVKIKRGLEERRKRLEKQKKARDEAEKKKMLREKKEKEKEQRLEREKKIKQEKEKEKAYISSELERRFEKEKKRIEEERKKKAEEEAKEEKKKFDERQRRLEHKKRLQEAKEKHRKEIEEEKEKEKAYIQQELERRFRAEKKRIAEEKVRKDIKEKKLTKKQIKDIEKQRQKNI
ncbi:S8 family serine peptidase, partial [Candidatus Woesearchaeota archaeon]|nr:S8 family serine peptidase [Candidatus Woesearchaeota archaeon]